MLAKTHMEILEEGISIFDFLDIARELYPKFPEDDIWFSDYLKKKIKTAYKADETLFSKELLLDRFGTVMEFDKALVKTIVEIYNEKIVGLTSKSDSTCEELLVITRFQEPSLVDTSALALAQRRGKMYADLPIFTYQRFDRESRPFCDVAPYKEAAPCEEDPPPPCPPCEEAPPCEDAVPCETIVGEEAPPCKDAVPCETIVCEKVTLLFARRPFPAKLKLSASSQVHDTFDHIAFLFLLLSSKLKIPRMSEGAW